MSVEDFDRTTNVNYRGCWLSSRAEIKQMRAQEVLATHDGRPGSRGAIGESALLQYLVRQGCGLCELMSATMQSTSLVSLVLLEGRIPVSLRGTSRLEGKVRKSELMIICSGVLRIKGSGDIDDSMRCY